MKLGVMLIGLGTLVSCYDITEENPYMKPVEEPVDPAALPKYSIPKEIYYSGSIQEDRIDKAKPVAKTLDWLNISTRDGNRYLDGAVEVDKVNRRDADNIFGVTVRLKNRTREDIHFEYKVQFVGKRGEPLLSHNRLWRTMMIEPFLFTEIEDYAEVRNAVGFRLFLRRPGSTDAGHDDETLKEMKWSGTKKAETPPADQKK